MMRINLLPPELIEKRRYERFYPLMLVIAVVLVVVVLVVWSALQLAVNQQNEVLQQTKTTTAQLTTQAESFAIFEKKQKELESREKVAVAALEGRIDLGRLSEDFSLVLPDEVFVTRISCNEETGLDVSAKASMSGDPAIKQGYKTVAATLVRLASIEQLYSVWLSSASVESFNAFQPVAASQGASATVMSFSVTSKIRVPAASGADE